ncbi:MAG: DUF445 family protein, partial [Oscillospiraceae bacterium]|nr:DUF445 family protein [Oscillospiraceae bacterium]
MIESFFSIIRVLAPEILAWAWLGYITNYIALRMLFNEYGVWKFKFGGVISRTREKFIDNLSNLVEDELISRDAIRDGIKSEAFLNAAQIGLEDVSNRLANKFGGIEKFSDIAGFDSAASRIANYAKTSESVRRSIARVAEGALAKVVDHLCEEMRSVDFCEEMRSVDFCADEAGAGVDSAGAGDAGVGSAA